MTQTAKTEKKPDQWSVWFFRLVQLVGLGAFLFELVVTRLDRPYILLVGLAMMLGGSGLQLVLMWAVRRTADK
jgi:hypothetical protein